MAPASAGSGIPAAYAVRIPPRRNEPPFTRRSANITGGLSVLYATTAVTLNISSEPSMRSIRWICVLFLLALALPASAQEADILTGRVLGADGKPIIGARVEVVSAETEITRSVLTDQNGRYLLQFPDGGGRYLVRITYIGLGDIVQAVVRNAEEELLLTDFVMRPQAIALDAITVAAQRPPPSQAGAGDQSTALSQEMLEPAAAAGPGPEHARTAGRRRRRHVRRLAERPHGLFGGRHERPAQPDHARRRGARRGVAGRARGGRAPHAGDHEHVRRFARRLRGRSGQHDHGARQQPLGRCAVLPPR
jgi:hypothetical protein